MKKGRGYSVESTMNWLKSMEHIKNELNNNNYFNVYKFIRSQSISCYWSTFLTKNNIIKKDNLGFYKWNEKVKIDINLLNKFREEVKIKQQEAKKQIKLNFDMPTSPLPPKPKTRKRNTNTKEVIVQQHQQQVGVIRKFLKWLW